MPKNDFLIGLEGGSDFVGGIIGDRQKQAALDVQKKQLELASKEAESTLQVRRDTLAEQIAHHSKLEEYQKSLMEGERIDRDWKVTSRKREVEGLARAQEFDQKLNDLMVKDPTGSSFFREGAELRKQYSDVFAHQSEVVRGRAEAVEKRGLEFLKSAEVSAMTKDVSDLVTGGYLNPHERQIPQSVAGARNTRDMELAKVAAGAAGVTLDEAVGGKLGTPELSPLGGWTPSYKAFVARSIEQTAKSKNEMAAAPDAKVELNVPLAEAQAAAGAEPPLTDLLKGGKVKNNVMTISTTLKEIQRSPYLRSIYEKTLGKTGQEDLIKGGDNLVVEVNGQRGTMSKADFQLNILKGNKVKVVGNAP